MVAGIRVAVQVISSNLAGVLGAAALAVGSAALVSGPVADGAASVAGAAIFVGLLGGLGSVIGWGAAEHWRLGGVPEVVAVAEVESHER